MKIWGTNFGTCPVVYITSKAKRYPFLSIADLNALADGIEAACIPDPSNNFNVIPNPNTANADGW